MSQEPEETIRVAFVDDDADLRERVFMPGLLEHGFETVGMGSTGEFYRRLSSESFDIVVLDIDLPDESGFEVVKHLRATSPAGIVMLTAHGDTRDRVRGLTVGADAYLAKPVEVELLAATLGSLARRMVVGRCSPPAQRTWRVQAEGWQLAAPNGRMIELTLPERCVLMALSGAAGNPVSREALISELTDDEYDFDPHRLEMLVYRLRRKVIQATGMELPLRAVRGQGYLLTSEQRRQLRWRT